MGLQQFNEGIQAPYTAGRRLMKYLHSFLMKFQIKPSTYCKVSFAITILW